MSTKNKPVKADQDLHALLHKLAGVGLHGIAPAAQQPKTDLVRWQLFRVKRPDGTATRHLIGHAVQNNEGRVSSAITNADLQKNYMVSSSGRVYQLNGDPGGDADAQFVFRNWMHFARFSGCVEITGAYVRLRRMRHFLDQER